MAAECINYSATKAGMSDRYKLKMSKIQDGGGRHLGFSKNYYISAAYHAISTKFGTVMQFDFLDMPDC